MNVKLGDVAIIIDGRWPNVGRVVYVAQEVADRDYRFMRYGILPSWRVESLGGDLATDAGPARREFIPDIALRRLDFTPTQAKAMRSAKADADFDAALAELAVVLAGFIEEPENVSVRTRKRQHATIPNWGTVAI
jgi:hypothetical protein